MSGHVTDVDAIIASARAAARIDEVEVRQFMRVCGASDGLHLLATGETFAAVPPFTSVMYNPSRGGLFAWGAGPMDARELTRLIRWADKQGIEVRT